jgi:hypothetical protein
MKDKTLFFILTGLFVILFFPRIQAQVTITFMQPPPNQWKMAYMWNLTIINGTSLSQTIYLHGTLTEAKVGLIAESTSAKFSLPPNYSGFLNTSWLSPVHQDYVAGNYEDVVRKTSRLPDGTYIICVTVCSLDGQELSKDCFEQTIANMSPPELAYPLNESIVQDLLPVFQWMPPMPAPMGEIVKYTLKMVEILDGQVAIESMEANPAFFIKESIRSVSFQLPLSARPFVAGHSYAWQVEAFGRNYEIGKSQVWKFIYGNNYQIRVDSLVFKKRLTLDGEEMPVLYDFAVYVTNENPGAANLSVTRITKTTPTIDSPVILPGEMPVTIKSGDQGKITGIVSTGKKQVRNICIEIKLEDLLSPKSNSVLIEECGTPVSIK